MTVFFSRFVVLACLCAVLPIAPPVEAAHLHGRHSMGKHATSPHPPHPTQKHPPSDGSFMEHKHENKHEGKHKDEHEGKHGGKHDEHHTHGDQRAGLPPLLRRYHFHGHSNAHYQGQDPHYVDDKIPRSVFARSRYHREPGSHSRRSSVYVPGEHGNTYIVSGTPPRHGKHAYGRRQADETDLASGRIDIMGAVQSPGSAQRLASLTVDSTPVDWTSGQGSAKAFPLNASTTNQTQFIMMPTDDTSTDGSTSKRVRLATEVFDAGGADMVMYCATYDANPGTPSALLMTPCSDTAQFEVSNDDATGPCVDNGDDASSSNSRQSQIFSYDPFNGVIEPILATDSSGSGSSSDSPRSCAGAKVRRDTGSSTGGSATPSSTSTSSAPMPSASKHSQNVTLVYVAGALEVPASSPRNATASATSTASAHINQAAVVTTTVTTTVVTTVVASGSATPAKAVESAPTSSSTTTTASLSTSSTTSSRAATTTPANESLEVEVVGVTPSTTTGSSSTSASGTATSLPSSSSSSSSSHASASPSLNAEAVASSVAKQMPHQGRAVAIASASVA